MAGIYIHIPYCKQACYYCNFHFSTNTKSSPEMLQAILQEIEMRKHELNNQSIQTIYFGGGTPGILPSDDIKKIMHAIEDNFIVEKNIETTLEVNPDDMHPQKLKAYLEMGINRLSVGTQSFFEEDLQYMNRSHDAKAAARCVQEAQDAGFNNISVDLIYGFPLLTNEKWKQNINTALALQITHLSCYAMTVEVRTALEKMIRTEKLPPINHAQSAEQFEWLMHAIEDAGWEHYEISNFAKPNHRAVHNTNYWLGKHYLGIGPSAHSFDGSSRSWNIVNNALFIKSIEEHILPSEKEILTLHQQINEYIMTSLRMSDGMQLQKIKPNVTTEEWQLFCEELEKNNALLNIPSNYQTKEGAIITLNNKGKLYADRIAGDLFVG
ncbi:MAG: radical SAM family heme chaperone HemW [Chitinophagaceae bacterium]|nr:radical SAM family heme chaperone HemW [Chitinophagaceae bacterium]